MHFLQALKGLGRAPSGKVLFRSVQGSICDEQRPSYCTQETAPHVPCHAETSPNEVRRNFRNHCLPNGYHTQSVKNGYHTQTVKNDYQDSCVIPMTLRVTSYTQQRKIDKVFALDRLQYQNAARCLAP